MREILKLIQADEARRRLAEVIPVGVETVSFAEAAGRVLAEPRVADEDLPPGARSTMDGYAIRAADVAGAAEGRPVRLSLAGTVAMGEAYVGGVGPGEAVGISTGGFLPEGADAVVMIEYTAKAPGAIDVSKAAARGGNVIQRGEDIRAGETVLAAGRRIRPQDLAALAAFGWTGVRVFRRPKIATLSTGNELCDAAEQPRPGQIRDSNQYILGAQARAAGCDVTLGGIVRDDAAELRAVLERLLADHDGVILAGGSSVGVKDVSAEVLAALGEMVFHGIHVRPGKPTIFARVAGKPVLGMPGYPTSSIIIFDAFVRPMLWRLGGESDREPWPARRRARFAGRYISQVGREDWLRVRLESRDGESWARTVPGGSAAISNVIRADGLVLVPAEREEIAEGTEVEVYL